MPIFSGTLKYSPPAPNQLRSFLVEEGGFTSLLVRLNSNPTQTANQLFTGLGKTNDAPLTVTGVQNGNVIVFTDAS